MKPDINALLATITERLETIQEILRNLAGTISANREKDDKPKEIRGVVQLPEHIESERSAEQKAQHATQKWIARGTWAATLAATVYAGIAAVQLSQTRRQLTDYEESQAAYLTIESASINQDRTEVTFMLVNRGQSVALGIVSGGGGGGSPSFPAATTSDQDRKDVLDNMSLLVGHTKPSMQFGWALGQGDKKQFTFATDPTQYWWNTERFSYFDIFGREHGITACWTDDGRNHFNPCPYTNEAGRK